MPTNTLDGTTLLITGATRGIGRAIALRAARDGANIAVLGKTATETPGLDGTVYSTCEEIERLGGHALACIADVRSEDAISAAVDATVKRFGALDILVNNASAIALEPTDQVTMKRFDLMHQVNARGTFLCAKLCLPHLRRSPNPHILTLSPPLALKTEWFAPHLAYSMSKFGMSLVTLGLAGELLADGIAVNSLWPRTTIQTAAVAKLGGRDLLNRSRSASIVADAAHAIVTTPSGELTGQFLIDESFLRSRGLTDFSGYASVPEDELCVDLFVEG